MRVWSGSPLLKSEDTSRSCATWSDLRRSSGPEPKSMWAFCEAAPHAGPQVAPWTTRLLMATLTTEGKGLVLVASIRFIVLLNCRAGAREVLSMGTRCASSPTE